MEMRCKLFPLAACAVYLMHTLSDSYGNVKIKIGELDFRTFPLPVTVFLDVISFLDFLCCCCFPRSHVLLLSPDSHYCNSQSALLSSGGSENRQKYGVSRIIHLTS